MFAIGFDLVVADAATHHPVAATAAYEDIRRALAGYGFERIQGSLYMSDHEDLARLFAAMNALRALPWFRNVVRDIRAFRVEQWSDFTATMKAP